MDLMIRYHRMRGDNTLWQVGTDHAGIATQIVVEQQLKMAGKSRRDLGRAEFVERVWAWKEESGSTITRQMRRLGVSADWSRERFTMDEGMSAAVLETFVRLFDDGLIYRGKRLVNWDPKLGTAVSDLEVENEEVQGKIWQIRYPMADGSGSVVVATTRPETMLGDVAVAVNPEDDRYRAMVGKMVTLPLTGRTIPIVAVVGNPIAVMLARLASGCADRAIHRSGRRSGFPARRCRPEPAQSPARPDSRD